MSEKKYRYISTKYFNNFSIGIRQWKAQHSHCCKIHGYAVAIKVWFASIEDDVDKQLDEMNWIQDYGGFKEQPVGNGLKGWLDHMFDHTLLIEKDDPYLDLFQALEQEKLCYLRIMDRIGAEACAKLVFDKFNDVLSKTGGGRVKVVKVEFWEDPAKNSSIYEEQW